MADSERKPIVVVGSIVYDLVMNVEHLPATGETVPGTGFNTFIGGKGLNQAIQIQRLDAPYNFFGRIGDDHYGHEVLEKLEGENFDSSGIKTVPGEHTAIGMIYVAPDGTNMIGGFPPANMNWSVDEITPGMVDAIENASVLSIQLETPVEFNAELVKIARDAGVTTLLNAAPWKHTPGRLAHRVDYWVVNEIEAGQFFNCKIETWEDCRPMASCPYISSKKRVWVVTLGDSGACLVDHTGLTEIPGIKVDAVDSTGAGDSFTGGFAVGISEGMTPLEAALFANEAASISVTKMGGMTGLPNRSALVSARK